MLINSECSAFWCHIVSATDVAHKGVAAEDIAFKNIAEDESASHRGEQL